MPCFVRFSMNLPPPRALIWTIGKTVERLETGKLKLFLDGWCIYITYLIRSWGICVGAILRRYITDVIVRQLWLFSLGIESRLGKYFGRLHWDMAMTSGPSSQWVTPEVASVAIIKAPWRWIKEVAEGSGNRAKRFKYRISWKGLAF